MADDGDKKLDFDDMYGGSTETHRDNPGKVSGTPVCRSAHSFAEDLRKQPGDEPITLGE